MYRMLLGIFSSVSNGRDHRAKNWLRFFLACSLISNLRLFERLLAKEDWKTKRELLLEKRVSVIEMNRRSSNCSCDYIHSSSSK